MATNPNILTTAQTQGLTSGTGDPSATTPYSPSQPVPSKFLNTIIASIPALDLGKHNRAGAEEHTGTWLNVGDVAVQGALSRNYTNENLSVMRDLAAFRGPHDSTGTFYIIFPKLYTDNSYQFKIKFFSFNTNVGCELFILGAQSDDAWEWGQASASGECPFTDISFGVYGSGSSARCCIAFGTDTTVLNKPSLEITELFITDTSDGWTSGWNIKQEVGATYTPTLTTTIAIPTTASTSLTTDEVPEGLTNLYFTASRAVNSLLTGYTTSPTGSVSATDSILAAIAKLENQIAGTTSTSMPIGTLLPFSGPVAPVGFMICDGRSLGSESSGATIAGSSYKQIFAILWNSSISGTSIWDSTGALTTKGSDALTDWSANKRVVLPNMRDRTFVGCGNSFVLGATGGEVNHKLTIAEMPAHTHGIYEFRDVNLQHDSSNEHDRGVMPWNPMDVASASTGGDGSHNNMPPYYAGNWIMLCFHPTGSESSGDSGATGCSSGCSYTCSTTCTGSCSSTCTGGCSGTCGDACSSSCTGGCSSGCTSCTGTCSGSCTSSCTGSCAGACTSCSGACTGSCSSCSGTCEGACKASCDTSCTGCGSCSGVD